jgi:hypothetical protein
MDDYEYKYPFLQNMIFRFVALQSAINHYKCQVTQHRIDYLDLLIAQDSQYVEEEPIAVEED